MKTLRSLFSSADETEVKTSTTSFSTGSSTITLPNSSSKKKKKQSGISTDTPIDINLTSQEDDSIVYIPRPQTQSQIPVFDITAFQTNIESFLEKKFEDLNEKRVKDKKTLESHIAKVRESTKTNSYVFKFPSNRIQDNFLLEISVLVDEAQALATEGSKKRLASTLKDVQDAIHKRRKVIRLADKSPAGWGTVDEYLPDDLASDSEDEKKIRQAENRALAKRSKLKRHLTVATPASNSMVNQQSAQQFFMPRQSFQPRYRSTSNTTGQGNVFQQPFLEQGAFGNRGTFPKPRFASPSNICFNCGLPGHWKHSCPAKRK